MTLNFPSSPLTIGQTYPLANGATYTWDGEKWKASNIPDSSDVVQTIDTPVNGEILKYEGNAVVWAPNEPVLNTEEVEDIVGGMVTGNTETNITVTYDDNTGKLNFVSTDTQLSNEEVQDIVGGMVSGNTESNITVTYDDNTGKLNFEATDTNTQLSNEQVQDIVGNMITGSTHSNLTVTYDDNANTLSFSATDTNTQLTNEQVQDIVGGMVDGGTQSNITVTYDDNANKLNFSATDTNTQLTNEQVQDIVGGMVTGNLEENITVTYDDFTGKLDFAATGGGGGGLTEFTEADNEATPNATTHVSSLTSNAGSTNADVAIVPKGSGAFLASVPDNTAAGGNKRGTNAVDLQTSRAQSNQVAGNDFSVIAGGRQNTASGFNSVISGGYNNTATSAYSAVLGGINNDSNANYSVSCGDSALAGGIGSFAFSGDATGDLAIAIGDANEADAQYSTCIGGYRGDTKGRVGVFVIPAGWNNNYGDAQYQIQNVKKQTTDATQTTLSPEHQGSTASVFSTFRLGVNQMHVIKGTCVAAKSDYSLVKAWDFSAVVKWENGTTEPVIVGTPNINVLMEETNSATWNISLGILTYSTTIASFVVNVTGQAETTIDWLCTLHSTELNTL